jgi:hypothetical protein
MDIHDSITVLAFSRGFENSYLVGDYYYDHDGTRGIIQEIDEQNMVFSVNPAPTREEYEIIMHRRRKKMETYMQMTVSNINTLPVISTLLSTIKTIRNKNLYIQREIQKEIEKKDDCVKRTMGLEEEVMHLAEKVKIIDGKLKSSKESRKPHIKSSVRNFHRFGRH